MTTYGTIPTSGVTNLEYFSQAKEQLKSSLGNRRPWKQIFNLRSIGVPSSLNDLMGRIRLNLSYFRTNYAIVVLLILFLSLLWHPISLVVFIFMMAIWLFLYFLRDEPLVILSCTIDDRVVLIVLSVLTIVILLLTNATVNILVSLLIGGVIVVVHAGFMKTHGFFLNEEEEEEERGGGGSAGMYYSGVPSSSSYSYSH